MKIVTYQKNIAEQNSYLLVERGRAWVIDPGFNGEAIEKDLTQHGWILEKVLLTHGHYDHIRDLQLLAKNRSLIVAIHRLDEAFLKDDKLNYAQAFGATFRLPGTCELQVLEDMDRLSFGNQSFCLHHTPGHTAGSSCYESGLTLFTGDTLFTDSVGRTDLSTGNARQLAQSLKRIRDGFSREIRVMPGHGEAGILKDILKNNAFLAS